MGRARSTSAGRTGRRSRPVWGPLPLLAIVLIAAAAGCRWWPDDEPTEQERQRWREAGDQIVGRWEDEVHTWQFHADGSYEHKETLSDDGVLETFFEDSGTWTVTGLEGEQLLVHVAAPAKDRFGIVTGQRSWSLRIDVKGRGMLLKYRYNSGDALRLTQVVSDPPEDEPSR